MTRELIERTAREWALDDTGRAARDLQRLGCDNALQALRSPDELVEALVELAGRIGIAQTRAW